MGLVSKVNIFISRMFLGYVCVLTLVELFTNTGRTWPQFLWAILLSYGALLITKEVMAFSKKDKQTFHEAWREGYGKGQELVKGVNKDGSKEKETNETDETNTGA